MPKAVALDEAQRLVERRRHQNRDAQKRRREKIRALQLEATSIVITNDYDIASASYLPPQTEVTQLDNVSSSLVLSPTWFGRFESPNGCLIETEVSQRSKSSSDTVWDLLSPSESPATSLNPSVLRQQPEARQKHQYKSSKTSCPLLVEDGSENLTSQFQFNKVLAYVKLAERMSKNLNKQTKDRLISAVLQTSQRNWQSCSESLPFPKSITFEGQRLYSAISMNALRLGISDVQLQDYEAISDIGKRWMTQSASSEGESSCWDFIPKNMHPTALQIVSRYHPFLDICFPWPSVRDRLIVASNNGLVDEDQLCVDLMIAGSGANGDPAAFVIWGTDTMDPESWEVGEQFAQRWSVLFDSSIIKRTNWWRKQRGLAPITIAPLPSSTSDDSPTISDLDG